MELSYWEYKTWLSNIDYAVVGSGIVGLSTALFLKERLPEAKILVLEKGVLPQGASTKNAGFACFGSVSEIVSDLKKHTEEEVSKLVAQRFKGIQLLRRTLGDANIDFLKLGGHELFLKKDEALYNNCRTSLDSINTLLEPVFGKKVFGHHSNSFGFQGIRDDYITHSEEGQLHTGKLMQTLLKLVLSKGVHILNSVHVQGFEELQSGVSIKTDKFEFTADRLLITTNGFAAQLLNRDVRPARAQVLITKPIENLAVKGTFHFDEGYYYFRNIDHRILFGGGRNLDFKTEETKEFGQTELIQNKLETLLSKVILPNTPFEIDHRWSGIMGVGEQKKPIIEQLSNRTYCGVRLGGMGIAIGTSVGKELAELVH